jgi:hypothetical protein
LRRDFDEAPTFGAGCARVTHEYGTRCETNQPEGR